MIRFADDTMLSQLKNIWHECFGDDEKYIDMYFGGRFKKGRCLVYTENDIPCAMLIIYDTKIKSGGEDMPVSYIYGVATHPDYQGKGISTKLLEYAKDLISKEGGFSVLAPATKELIEFYEKRGYYKSFFVKQAEWDVSENDINAEFSDVSAGEYKRLRDIRFDREGYISWSGDIIEYALHENHFFGGKTRKISVDGAEYAVMYYVNDGMLYVQETTLTDEVVADALNVLAKEEGCTKVSARLCANSRIDGEIKTLAMADKRLSGSGYFNIVFD